MDSKKILSKMENDLSEYLVTELCKADSSRRTSGEMYKYKGLNIALDSKNKKSSDKTIFIRIGVMEAEFKLGSCEKCSGGLSNEEEKIIKKWLSSSDNSAKFDMFFLKHKKLDKPKIIPFDLEHYYS